MNDATLIADLVRAGVDPELVGRVANAIASASASGGIRVDATAEKRRAWDREYRRNRKKTPPDSTRIPPDPPENENSALYLSSSLQIQNQKEGKKERKRGERIPPDWAPNAGHLAAGAQLGFSDREIAEQAEDMRLWAQSNDHRAVARKSNWDMTFLAWLRRNKPKANGHGRNGTPRNGGDLARELAAEVRERERTAGLFGSDDVERGR